jgi:hypothetical protein
VSEEYKKWYGRGYSAGLRNEWSDYKPPTPPEPVIAELMNALIELRDAVSGEIGKFGEDDEIYQLLDPLVGRADYALSEVKHWLKGPKQ